MLLFHEYFVTEMKEVANLPHTLSTSLVLREERLLPAVLYLN